MDDVEGELRHSFSKIQGNDKYFEVEIGNLGNLKRFRTVFKYLGYTLVFVLIVGYDIDIFSDYFPLIVILGIVGIGIYTIVNEKFPPKKIVQIISFYALKSKPDLSKELQQNIRRWLNEKGVSEISIKERDGDFDNLVYLTDFVDGVLVFELIGSEEETQKIVDELYDINYTSFGNRTTTSDVDFNKVRFQAYYSRNKVVLTDNPELRSVPGLFTKEMIIIYLGINILFLGMVIWILISEDPISVDMRKTLLPPILNILLLFFLFIFVIVTSIGKQFSTITHRKMKVYIHSPNAHYGMEHVLREKFKDFRSLEMKNYRIYSTRNLIFNWKGFTKKDVFELQILVPRWQKFSLEEFIGEGVDFPLFTAYKSKALGIKDRDTLSQALKAEKRMHQQTQKKKERELFSNSSSLSTTLQFIFVAIMLFSLFIGGILLLSPDPNYQNQYLQYETSGIGSEVNSEINIPARTLVRYKLTISNGNDTEAVYTATGKILFDTSIRIHYDSKDTYRNTTSETHASEIFTEKGFVFSLRINGNTTNSLKIYYGYEFKLTPLFGPLAIFSILGLLDMMALASMNEMGDVSYQQYKKFTSDVAVALKLPYEQHRVDADFIGSDPKVENKPKSKLWKISLAMVIIYSSVLLVMNLLSSLFPNGMYMYTHLILESNMLFWDGLLFIFYLPIAILGVNFDKNRNILTKFSIVFTIQIAAIIVIHPLMWKYLKYLYF